MSNLALDYTRRLEAARQRRFAQQRARQQRMDALPLAKSALGLSSVLAMPQIKMHITPWTVDRAGIKTRWVFQEGDYPL